jgi:hypothetical protein
MRGRVTLNVPRGDILTITMRRRMSRGRLALAVVLILPLTACGASEPKAYGPTTAGPTKTSGPSTAAPADMASLAAERTQATGAAALCNLFTTAEITDRLGLEVSEGTAVKSGPYSVCTWKTTTAVNKRVPGGGIVTITRADGRNYPDFEKKIRAVAKTKKAHGRRDLEGIGDTAFALGASVSGVPIWHAATLQGDLMMAAELSGAKSKSSVGTITDFLVEVLARG